VNRGVAWWSDGASRGERRILEATADGLLVSLDARTGKPDPNFGELGVVNLRAGMGKD
jgi:quinoprotein glucose dehydrogenase